MHRPAPTRKTTLAFQNGGTYEGEVAPNGLMHGRGILTYDNGEVYDGQFVRGRRFGCGAYHHASGVVTVSEWLNDRTVGVAVRWSADRRRAWVLLDGKVERDLSGARVAPVNAATAKQHGLEWDKETMGEMPLDRAWEMVETQPGLCELAVRIGAPRRAITTTIAVTHRKPPTLLSKPDYGRIAERHNPPLQYAPEPVPAHRPSPQMRQAAFMEGVNRLTHRPPPPRGAWAWPLAQPEPPPQTVVVERSIFKNPETAARSAAAIAAAGCLARGAVDPVELSASIHSQMRRAAPQLPPAPPNRAATRAAPRLPPRPPPQPEAAIASTRPPPGVWLTPGATPFQPSPTF
jgi:hypothetical protein